MATPARPKKQAEIIVALKPYAATKAEAQTAVLAARTLAEDPETPQGLRSLANWYRTELEGRPEDQARRETLLASLTAIAANYTT
jgi:hypothetical protein